MTNPSPSPIPSSADAAPRVPSDPTRRDSFMRARQRPLMRLYRREPEAARIRDGACTVEGSLDRHDPVHGELLIGTSQPLRAPLSIHAAVGGDHDGPNPGDYLAAALVGCFDSTLRIVADRFGAELTELSVSARCEVDVRGTLCVSSEVPVGFQRIELRVRLAAADAPPAVLHSLVAATEHCCVVLQTLRGALPVELIVEGVEV